jgi:hypothetical protein
MPWRHLYLLEAIEIELTNEAERRVGQQLGMLRGQ